MSQTLLEGFWFSEREPWFPMPQPYVGPWLNKELFLLRLTLIQERCRVNAYRGMSTCRICGTLNGNEEFSTDDWKWPSGYRHYIDEHNVRPSTAFEKVVLGDRFDDLEPYLKLQQKTRLHPSDSEPKLAKRKVER